MAKVIQTQNVAGVDLELSKARKGIKCKCCGAILEGEIGYDYFRTHTKTCSVAYVCRDCITHRSYGSDITNKAIVAGKLTSGKYRFAIELEANYFDNRYPAVNKTDTYLAAQWGLQPSKDCTVGVEYHMTNKVNFHGLKDFLEDVSKNVEMDAPNCGHHINISKITWTAHDMDMIRQFERELFDPFMVYLKSHRQDTINLFGRFFGDWADADRYYVHGSWLNLDNTYHMEFRLPHFSSVNQFFYCCNFCRDVVDILDEWLDTGDLYESSAKASKKIIAQFQKYSVGKANCQRKERNKTER